jgi:hypothetical protein
MAYRDDLTALSARHDALAGEVAQKTRELDDSRQLLEQARARAKLPILDNIRVASPCTADWNQMTGDDRTRHCGECRKNVYNLSGMTREEAEALLIERNGDLCVRYFQRQDGTILLADCTIGAKRTRRRRWIAAGAAAMLASGAGVMQVAKRGPYERLGGVSVVEPHDIKMGEITVQTDGDLPPVLAPPTPDPPGNWIAGGIAPMPQPPPPPVHPARPAHPSTAQKGRPTSPAHPARHARHVSGEAELRENMGLILRKD